MAGALFRVGLTTLAVLGTAGALAGGRPPKPGGIQAAAPGLWEVSRSATGASAERVCLADPADLAEWESRGQPCTRTRLSEQANRVDYDYRCTGGAFGRASLTLLTPRSLRVEVQGISNALPFDYVLFARRTGPCGQPLPPNR